MRGPHRHPDEGFSLVEVIVAIVILGIVASSALYFFINGMQTSSNLDRQQRAVAIATSTMESTFTFDPHLSPTAGVSGLVIGRSATEVNAAFTKFAGVDGVSDTYPLSDPHGATGLGRVKVFDTVSSADHMTYDVYTLIGSCYRSPAVAGAAQPCTKVGGYLGVNEPAAVSPGVSRELRVIVVVTWKPIGGECDATAGICSYHVATLVDPSNDLAWNRVIRPVAVDDPDYTYDPIAGNPTYGLDVMSNDVLGSVRSNPVQPVAGSGLDSKAGGITFPTNGIIQYTPPPATPGNWASGIFTFKYQVFDRTGASSSATVTITLHPQAVPDPDLTASQGVPKVLDVLANDLGSPTAVQIVGGPYLKDAKISVSGTTVTYTPGAYGTDNFTYKFTDAAGQSSQPVLATVNVQALNARDVNVALPYSATSTSPIDITSYFLAANPGVTNFTITGGPTPNTGSLYVNGTKYTGSPLTGQTITFQPPAGTAGQWTFPFKVVLGARTSDNTANAVITVPAPAPPVARNDGTSGTPFGTLSRKNKNPQPFNAGLNDDPTTWASSDLTVKLGTIAGGCGSWTTSAPTASDLAAGQVQITPPGSNKTACTATYTLTRGGVSSTATIYYKVVN